MFFYEVIPADNKFHGKEPLTYSYEHGLQSGQTVILSLRGKRCLGIVIRTVNKPEFKTVSIDETIEDMTLPSVQIKLLEWMIDFYPGSVGGIAQLFAPGFLIGPAPGSDDGSSAGFLSPKLPPLTKEQEKAYRDISKNFNEGKRTNILFGVTGSGKTRLYLELARDSLEKKKSVIILTPEISLTAPIAKHFESAFGNSVEINHSSLTTKQRRELWGKSFRSKKPMVIIGPRSTLFLPLKNIGLIVSDEFHEPAYKQESRPFYHANRVASMLTRLSSANLIFGSATPPVTDYYMAEQKYIPVIRLEHLALTGEKPSANRLTVNLLDNSEKTSYPLISRTLITKVSDALKKGDQAMLFINKRGSARSVSCQDCGSRETCINCDLPLVYHGDQHILRCHTCGFSKAPPSRCPSCGSANIYFNSPGTKAIVESLSKIFPDARIARFDKDNKKAERLENVYDDVLKDVDIIVGTQIIAKGHDLPRLSVVAMLLGDSELDFPDFSSSERAYQLIRQLEGRVNRGHKNGVFIVQTFNPDSPSVEAGIQDKWKDFYNQEILQRKKHGFPPFYSVMKIESARSSAKSAEQSLNKLLDKLSLDSQKVEILGPSPNFVEKKASKWHWQVLIKSKSRSTLAALAHSIPSSFRVDIDPNNFL
ncbi:MAG TPA: primosomal protein N' [Candidatus Saccharimonadales bacterium]|nr:primosomal protein N' [Candidatus Saccharimonadales bacterium]